MWKNKIKKYISRIFLACTSVLMTACGFDEAGTQPVDFSVRLVMPQEFVQPLNQKMTVSLLKSGKVIYSVDAEEGVAVFQDIIPDVYDLSTSLVISSDVYEDLTGETVQNGKYVVSGALLGQIVATNSSVDVQTTVSRKQSLVVSKIYYAGSKDNNNKNYLAGRYLEFYNNSDEEIDIAGTYVGLLESETTPAYMIGDTPDYIYLKQIFRFPHEGKTKLLPGESVLVVNSAIDHRSAAPREADLSNADFETKDDKNNNNPDVPAMELIYTAYATIPSMNLLQGGPCGVVLFTTDEDVDSWERVYKQGASKGNRYVKAPVKYVTDGVECLKYSASGIDTGKKRLYDYIDAGYINIEAATGYNGQVVYRKMESGTDGDSFTLVDTNNSGNDFGLSSDIYPGEFQ